MWSWASRKAAFWLQMYFVILVLLGRQAVLTPVLSLSRDLHLLLLPAPPEPLPPLPGSLCPGTYLHPGNMNDAWEVLGLKLCSGLMGAL